MIALSALKSDTPEGQRSRERLLCVKHGSEWVLRPGRSTRAFQKRLDACPREERLQALRDIWGIWRIMVTHNALSHSDAAAKGTFLLKALQPSPRDFFADVVTYPSDILLTLASSEKARNFSGEEWGEVWTQGLQVITENERARVVELEPVWAWLHRQGCYEAARAGLVRALSAITYVVPKGATVHATNLTNNASLLEALWRCWPTCQHAEREKERALLATELEKGHTDRHKTRRQRC